MESRDVKVDVLVSETTTLTITLMKKDKEGMAKVPEARENMMLGSWKESRMCHAKRTKKRVASQIERSQTKEDLIKKLCISKL